MKKPKLCYWCGELDATTKDDVFPETLILGPKPNRWLRVPACRVCNESLQMDEQYFRFVILLGRNYLEPRARQLWNEGMRPYLRRSPNFTRHLFESLELVDVGSPGGIFLGKAEAHPVNEQRMNRVLEKIARGLYYIEHKRPLGESRIIAWFFDNGDRVPEEVRAIVLQAPVRVIGDAIRYRYVYANADPRCTFTLMRFYQSGLFIVSTVPPDPKLPAGSPAKLGAER